MPDYESYDDEELRGVFERTLKTMEWADENGEPDLYQLMEGRLAEMDRVAAWRGLTLTDGIEQPGTAGGAV